MIKKNFEFSGVVSAHKTHLVCLFSICFVFLDESDSLSFNNDSTAQNKRNMHSALRSSVNKVVFLLNSLVGVFVLSKS